MRRGIMLVAAIGVVVMLGAAAAMAGGDAGKGQVSFQMYCSACHGSAGKGDGPGAGALNPKPRDLTDGKYMSTLKDQYLFDVIAKGGSAFGKSPAMPPWNPTLKDDDIRNVIAFIRSVSKPLSASGR